MKHQAVCSLAAAYAEIQFRAQHMEWCHPLWAGPVNNQDNPPDMPIGQPHLDRSSPGILFLGDSKLWHGKTSQYKGSGQCQFSLGTSQHVCLSASLLPGQGYGISAKGTTKLSAFPVMAEHLNGACMLTSQQCVGPYFRLQGYRSF